MKLRILSLLRPSRLLRAWRFRNKQGPYDRSASDLELQLYSRILTNDMLHYGYFEDPGIRPDEISIAEMEAAQERYARLLLNETTAVIAADGNPIRVLDAGCGMGGLSGMLLDAGCAVDALTPNRQQAEYIGEKHPELPVHLEKYEHFRPERLYDAVIHSESLQYIPLEDAFRVTGKALRSGGRWIISDYFRLERDGDNASGHLLEDFLVKLEKGSWRIVSKTDITANVVPTLRLIRLYTDRFLLPLGQFGLDKFRVKKPFLYDLSEDLRKNAEEKLGRELASVDPERFIAEKQYLLFVLEKQ